MLSPTSVTLLRMLADAGGAVVSRSALQEALPDARDDHAVDVAVGRLRQALNHPGIIATVVKRGYRLNT
jgi:uroporphyrinogen-III synthase